MTTTTNQPTATIGFASDFGLSDGYVAACHGVLAAIAPASRVIDIGHDVPSHQVRRGAALLARVAPYLPRPLVVFAVVDPGVGTTRRAIALVTPHARLVGPDNGLLGWAAQVLGGAIAAYELAAPEFQLPAVSATFHGRDVFAPAAAHLAVGVAPERLGPRVDPSTLVALPDPLSIAEPGRVRAEVTAIDRFGNVELAAGPTHLRDAGLPVPNHHATAKLTVSAANGRKEATAALTFGAVAEGAWVLYVDSSGLLGLAIRESSAAAALGVREGDVVTLEAAPK